MLTFLVFAAAIAAAPSHACAQLADSFDMNEWLYSVQDGTNKVAVESNMQYGLVREANIAQRRREADAEQYLREGDRITTLLLANHCTPPDHVTSPSPRPAPQASAVSVRSSSSETVR